ncbi:hypothetical protein BDF22DRAFT_227968 [Syncephalis plumigaleata]|nr:hypothetical protein BDF22DRAFT_227968 [Syncephalis plumigaleata]
MSVHLAVWLGCFILVWLVTHLILRILWFPRWIGEYHWTYSNNEVQGEFNDTNEEADTAIELLPSLECDTRDTAPDLRELESTQRYSSTLSVTWCRIQWETTRQFKFLYRWIQPLDHRHHRNSDDTDDVARCTLLWSYWFDMGILWGGLLMPVAVMAGLLMAIQLISRIYHYCYYSNNAADHHAGSTVLLVTALPGFNLPWSHVPLQLMAICIATLWHEMGHAMSAIHAHVPIQRVGMFFWFIYPGAYVKVDSHVLTQVSIRKQLRIMLAGVWHNIVLVAMIMLLLASGLLDIPWSWLGWNRIDSGVIITNIATTSPLSQLYQWDHVLHE